MTDDELVDFAQKQFDALLLLISWDTKAVPGGGWETSARSHVRTDLSVDQQETFYERLAGLCMDRLVELRGER